MLNKYCPMRVIFKKKCGPVSGLACIIPKECPVPLWLGPCTFATGTRGFELHQTWNYSARMHCSNFQSREAISSPTMTTVILRVQ